MQVLHPPKMDGMGPKKVGWFGSMCVSFSCLGSIFRFHEKICGGEKSSLFVACLDGFFDTSS